MDASALCSDVAEPTFDLRLGRFANLDDQDFLHILDQKNAINTKKSTSLSVKTFREYLAEKQMKTDFEYSSRAELDANLLSFYGEARTKAGEHYKKTSLNSLRHGINRHLQNSVDDQIDIVNGVDLKKSRDFFKAMGKELKRMGKSKIEHKTPLGKEDLQKMYEYFSLEDPTRLQQKVFVDVMLHFGRRGRENLRDLVISDFTIHTDSLGLKFLTMRDEATKNHQDDLSGAEGRMYEVKGDPKCPLVTHQKSISKLNPRVEAFFQRPKVGIKSNAPVWYDAATLGHCTLEAMLGTISKSAGLSQVYTNHCIRATTVHMLDEANIPGRHIISVTGHASETSLKTYTGHTDEEKKRLMSKTLSASSGHDVKVSDAPSESTVPASSKTLELPAPSLLSNSQVESTLNVMEVDNALDMYISHLDTSAYTSMNMSSTSSTWETRFPSLPTMNNCSVTINYNFNK